MATSSILQSVCVKDRKKVAEFVKALEQSKDSKAQEVVISRKVEQVTDSEKIRQLFEVSDSDGI